jgi:hypothetical protein
VITLLAQQLGRILQSEVQTGGTEPEIIKRFTTQASTVSLPPRLRVESVFVHQKPYAYFVLPPNICGKIRVELGDILFIVKRLRRGKVYDHRFSFAQAKQMTNGRSRIEVHQFRFYRDLSRIQFRFGNSVFKKAGSTPLVWRNLSSSLWFGHYLFLRSRFEMVAKISVIETQFSGGCSHFHFSADIFSPSNRYGPSGAYTFEAFMISFLQLKGIGARVGRQTTGFLDIILKHVHWIVDPPEETKGYFEETKDGGFGIIRITIRDEEE